MSNPNPLEEARRMLAERRREVVETLPELPAAPDSVEATGLRDTFLQDLVVKLLFLRGNLTGREICDGLGLPYTGVLEHVFRTLKDDRTITVHHGASASELEWEFTLPERGQAIARDILPRNGYAGIAPVPIDEYIALAATQTPEWQQLNAEHMREAFRDLVVSDSMLMRLGPAFNSGRSMFLYGHAGNGKTLMSEKMGESVRGGILIPYAVEAGGHVIQMFDRTHHEFLGERPEDIRMALDRRWAIIRRPFIVVGGELLMEDLEMAWTTQGNHYSAPLQLKANGGVFMIDDFGRQRMPARDLLNRWIVPLEKQYDYHLLSGGIQLQVPFNLLIIFSTNLEPKDLVEEAFLRRIRYKIEVGDPTAEQFREIFQRYCVTAGIEFKEDQFQYLLKTHYQQAGRGFRATHPRDLLSQLKDIARFNGLAVELTHELLDAAVETYFVDLG